MYYNDVEQSGGYRLECFQGIICQREFWKDWRTGRDIFNDDTQLREQIEYLQKRIHEQSFTDQEECIMMYDFIKAAKTLLE